MIKKILMPIVVSIFVGGILIIALFVGGGSGEESSSGGNSVSNVYGETIQEKVWFSLKDEGFSECQIAAAMGNIHYESATFNPEQIEIGYTEDNGRNWIMPMDKLPT